MKNFKRISKFLLTLFVLFSCSFLVPLSAAGPITHALLTENLFRLYPQYNDEEKMAFRAGTLFSGIRNLGALSDEETLFPGVCIEEILSEPSAFHAGMMFHAFVDNVREEFIQEGDYYDLLSGLSIKNEVLYLKFLEDQIMFPSLDKTAWKLCANTIHPDEMIWGVNEETLKKWHYLLDLSFCYQPSMLIFLTNLKGTGFLTVSAKEVSVWNKTFDGVSKRNDVEAYVSALLQNFASQM